MPDPVRVLDDAIARARTPACVGIDPVLGRISDEAGGSSELATIERFCLGVLDAAAAVVGVVKPQSACFERYGSGGCAVLERVIDRARALDLVVILDAKRADIGSSAAHYAAGAASMGAHWITVSPYMGRSSIEPFVDEGLGVFALCRTSNPDAAEVQGAASSPVASMIASLGPRVGAVVGATLGVDETRALRAAMPDSVFLVPGVGAQGGTMDAARAMARDRSSAAALGLVINASRSVLYPEDGGGAWTERIARAAGEHACACAALVRSDGEGGDG